MDVTALRNCGLLFLAGGAGALARYGVSELANTLVGRQYPLGTFVVNVLGCFLFGLIWELAAVRLLIPDTVRLIILVGFMGSFTTFSSLIFDSFALGQTRLALLLFNIGGPIPGHDRGQALVARGPVRRPGGSACHARPGRKKDHWVRRHPSPFVRALWRFWGKGALLPRAGGRPPPKAARALPRGSLPGRRRVAGRCRSEGSVSIPALSRGDTKKGRPDGLPFFAPAAPV